MSADFSFIQLIRPFKSKPLLISYCEERIFMVKIFIDPGHGGKDAGAEANNLREKDVTLDISKRIKRYLDHHYDGHTTRLSRTKDTTLTLSERTNDANQWGADYFLSIHINAGGGTGYEDYIFDGHVSNRTISMRNTIHREVIKQMKHVTNRGKKRANLHVVRESTMSSMLGEVLFIDTKQDAQKLKDGTFKDNVAKGYSIGLAKALSLQKDSNPSNKAAKKKQKTGYKWLGTNLKGKRVESIYRGKEGLNYYDGPRWNNPSGTFGYGEGWKVDNKYLVDGSPMYRVQNSKGDLYFITASTK